MENPCNEQLLSTQIWNEKKSDNLDSEQYYNKYELLKGQALQNEAKRKILQMNKKNKILIPPIKSKKVHEKNTDDIDDIDSGEVGDECVSINKVNVIDIKPNDINSEVISHTKPLLCMTEPDECFYPRNFYYLESPNIISHNITPQQAKPIGNYGYFPMVQQRNLLNQFAQYNGSFVSTQHSSHRMQESNDDKMRLQTNESAETNSSTQYQKTFSNVGVGSWDDVNNIDKKIYSASFNESNYYNAFTLNNYKNAIRPIKKDAKNEKQVNLNDIACGKDVRTTLMIRNIPIKYTDKMMLKELEKFENKFDCLYMPYDFETGGNKGYAFINFTHHLHILLFYEMFQKKTWQKFESKKICELNFANFQGINEIKKHAKNYKGFKKPTFFIITDDLKNNIEVPLKYLKTLISVYPKMSYIEKKQSNTFLIRSFH